MHNKAVEETGRRVLLKKLLPPQMQKRNRKKSCWEKCEDFDVKIFKIFDNFIKYDILNLQYEN